MGIFSDDDINEADDLVKKSANRMEFLKGFERGWKGYKRDGYKPDTYATVIVEMYERYLQEGIDKNPENFGSALGMLVALIRFYPKKVLQYPQVFIKYFRALSNHQPFYNYAVSRIKRWNKKIKTMIGELSPSEQKAYADFLKSV